jgi:butyrate kinase
MEQEKRILVINPGSTGTKLAIFKGSHKEAEELCQIDSQNLPLLEQVPERTDKTLDFLQRHGDSPLSAVVGRGGLIRPVPSGTISINEKMLEDAKRGYQGEHVSNLGCIIAFDVAKKYGVPSFIVDPVAVDEMAEEARLSGLPGMDRQALAHALNLHAAARKACGKIGKNLAESRFVVAHLGGGFSIVPMVGGKILDTNNANSGGPMSPTRAGTLPTQPLIKLCFSGKHELADVKKMTTKKGGLLAHLETDDAREVEKRIESGDKKALLVYKAMAYQTAKEIGAMAAAIGGSLDGIVITGGLAHSELFCAWLEEKTSFIAKNYRFPGEFEMEALAMGALRVLNGEEKALEYGGDQ